MKKILSLLVCFVMVISLFPAVACSDGEGKLVDGKTDVKYAITVDDQTIGGEISSSASSVVVGESVTFTVSPQSGYVLADLILNGSAVAIDGSTYTVKHVLRNYTATAVFAQENVSVSFDGEGTSGFSGKVLKYGEKFGELPAPIAKGKTFVCWLDEAGNAVTENDEVCELDGSAILTAQFTDCEEKVKQMQKPFSITTAYYDQAATKYGVAWHTKEEPIAPRLLLVEGDGTSGFDQAKVYSGEKFKWLTTDYGYEWIVDVVVDELEFNTTYSVKFGDWCADSWSDVYTFTTREEYPENAKFIYIADSQENNHVVNQNGVDTYMSQTLKAAFTKFSDVDFIAHGGDVVNDSAYPCRWEEMLGSVDEYLFNYPMMITMGNHEDATSYNNVSNQYGLNKIFNVNNALVDGNEKGGLVYSFDYGPVHFVSLRTNDGFTNGYKLAQTQIDWLVSDVTAANENPNVKWVVVMMHQGPIIPTFTKLNSNSFTSEMGPQVIPVLDELDVDLVLYGHNHYLDSTYPLVWDESVVAGVDKLKVKPATTSVDKTTYDGETVDKFVFDDGVTNRGTVFHQTGTCGNQTDSVYEYAKLSETLAANPNYRMLISGTEGKYSPTGKTIQMYSYVEISGNSLVLRTYGVNVNAQIKDTTGSIADYTTYLDGFMLTK